MSRGSRAEQGEATREAGGAPIEAQPADQGAETAERPAPRDDEGTIRVKTYSEEGRRDPLYQGRAYTHGVEIGRAWATSPEGALAAATTMLKDELKGKEPGRVRLPPSMRGEAKTRK